MVVGARMFTGDVLTRLGLVNVFGAGPGRYPRVEVGEIRAAAPEVVLLPDEPYPFTAEDGRRNSPPSASCSSVSDILCAGFFPVRYQMFIRYPFFALSDVLVPVLFSGSGESDFPCCSGADAACPGFLPVVLVPGAAALSLPDHLAAAPVRDLNIADGDGRGG
jgi:hypothetical protein